MDVKELNKSQLILLTILLSFITSIATGITTVTLLEKAPQSVTVPINTIVRQTVDKIVPADKASTAEGLSLEQKELLEELKSIKPLTVSVYLKGNQSQSTQDRLLGTGLFLGNEKIVIGSLIPVPKEGEQYIVKSVLGEQKVLQVTQEKDFTLIELVKAETPSNSGTSTTVEEPAP
jgi:hypothetical protein